MINSSPDLITWFQIFLAGVGTLGIFSFLIKENPFYRFFEHLFIGVATAVFISQNIQTFLWPDVLKPLLGLDRPMLPDGTPIAPYDNRNLLFLLPMAFGLLYYFILSKRHVWLAQLVIGFSLGVGSGLVFKGFVNEMFPQISDSWRPLYVAGDVETTLNNIIFVTVLLSTMTYFFFTFRRRPGGVTERVSSGGRFFMMGCFGAFFGSTIMARMALLVERMQFLLNTWWPNFAQFPSTLSWWQW